MNLVGKILTTLIFILTIVFMWTSVMVYSMRTNWFNAVMAPTTGYKDRLAVANQEKTSLADEVARLTTALEEQRNAQDQAIAKLSQEVGELTTERNNLQAQEAQLTEDQRKAVAMADAAQVELAKIREEISGLRGGIVKAQADRNAAFTEMLARMDQLHQAANELSTLKSRNTQLAEQVARMGRVLESRGATEFDEPGPPTVDGVVLAVRGGGIVELSIGADEGLEKGDRLEVVRQGGESERYMGAVEILQTQPDKSVARIIPETRQGSIEKEDRVYSRLR